MPGIFPVPGCMPAEDMLDCLYDEALGERGLDAIANMRGMELSDDASVILLYSDNGERSAQATEHMEAIGYVNVYDAGGLAEWPYDVVTTDEERTVAAALAASGNIAQEGALRLRPRSRARHGCGCDSLAIVRVRPGFVEAPRRFRRSGCPYVAEKWGLP